jgi:NADH-ubiquinone oxidoreductase chain 2
MAGIPPLIGFFSKQFVLFSSIENGNNFLSIVAILVSVISASYYLKLVKLIYFDDSELNSTLGSLEGGDNSIVSNYLPSLNVSNVHSYIISLLTLILSFFFINPSLILNGTQLISITIFNI